MVTKTKGKWLAILEMAVSFQSTEDWIPNPPMINCVTLDNLFPLPETYFFPGPFLQNKNKNSYLTGSAE